MGISADSGEEPSLKMAFFVLVGIVSYCKCLRWPSVDSYCS